MAVKLTTSAQKIGDIYVNEPTGGEGYKFRVYAYYTMSTTTTANVYVQLSFNESSVSGSGTCTLNGTNSGFSFSSNSMIDVGNISVSYTASTGKCTGKSLSVSISGMSASWSDGTRFDASPKNSVSITFDLPDIDATPTFSKPTTALLSKGYTSSRVTVAVAGKSKLRVTISNIKYARNISYTWKAGSIVSGSGTINVTYSATAVSKTFDVECPVSTSNYNFSATVTISNNTSSTSSTSANYTVYGYTLPITSNSTTVYRWSTNTIDTTGKSDSNGKYGRLYLKWSVKTSVTNNALKSTDGVVVKVKIDSTETTLTASDGSIADGYLIYFTPEVATNKEAKFTIILTDEIDSNTITTWGVTKAIMPLSLYQNNNNVGVAVGAMATGKGFYIYEQETTMPLYMQIHNGTKLYAIYLDANGVLYIGGKAVSAYTARSTLSNVDAIPSEPEIDYGPDDEEE